MLFTNPLFMPETYIKDPASNDFAINMLSKLESSGTNIHA